MSGRLRIHDLKHKCGNRPSGRRRELGDRQDLLGHESERITTDQIVDQLLDAVPVPRSGLR